MGPGQIYFFQQKYIRSFRTHSIYNIKIIIGKSMPGAILIQARSEIVGQTSQLLSRNNGMMDKWKNVFSTVLCG
jgi:hypothetical protein